MKHALEVAPGERLKGLEVIGFHGRVAPQHTPAQREPLLVDEEGRLVRLERMESSPAVPPLQRVLVHPGESWTTGLQEGHATQLARPWPAHWGYTVVLLGKNEQAHASALATVEPRIENPPLNKFVQWLAEAADAPLLPMVQRLGELVAWYCSPAQAFALYHRIARVAETAMVRAANAGEHGALYDTSWWLSRAALDDAGRFLAAVGLEQSDPGMADAYLKSTFRKRHVEEIEAALAHARGVFSSLREAARRIATAQAVPGATQEDSAHATWRVDIGSLSPTRGSARKRFMVPTNENQRAA